jgi:NDP-4-keto-2,6-dideoxyhexose 3-C-methyltransferase
MKCKNCKKNSLKRIVKIGKQPLSGFFYLRKETNLPKYSLDLYKCSHCSLVQLNNLSDTKKMYGSHYGYKTSVSKMMVSHLREKVKRLKKYEIIKKGNNLLDIGSNDASFLKLLGKNCNLYGIDPSAKKFKKEYKGMKLITDFFSKKNILKNIKNENIKFDLISSFAMFYDVEDPNSFCQDVEMLLSDNGIWVCEFSYLPLMLKNLTFDQICHEHVMYYTFGVFEKILLSNNLKVTNIKLNEINGGSIEVIITKNKDKRKINTNLIKKIKDDEKKINEKAFNNFSERIKRVRNDLVSFVNKNQPIVGYGASTKGNIVLNYCNINSVQMPYICDANKQKSGKFTPGTNIKITSKEKMRVLNPKYTLVLIWSFRSEIIKQELSYIKKGGNLIFHLPKFHIINKKNYRNFINKDFRNFSYKY